MYRKRIENGSNTDRKRIKQKPGEPSRDPPEILQRLPRDPPKTPPRDHQGATSPPRTRMVSKSKRKSFLTKCMHNFGSGLRPEPPFYVRKIEWARATMPCTLRFSDPRLVLKNGGREQPKGEQEFALKLLAYTWTRQNRPQPQDNHFTKPKYPFY